MKDLKLGLFALSSILIGYIYNLTLLTPVVGTLLFWLMPFVLLIYWFWVGGKFAEGINNPIIAIIFGNSFGVISILLYIWQFNFLSDAKRSMLLAGFSQVFSAPLSWITVRLGVLFEAKSGMISQTSLNAMQVIGLLIMVVVFTIGYSRGRKKLYKRQSLDF